MEIFLQVDSNLRDDGRKDIVIPRQSKRTSVGSGKEVMGQFEIDPL